MKLRRTVHLLGSFALMTALLGGAHAEQAAPVAGPPGAASHAIQAAPMPLTEHEALPPSGKGNLFSDAQVRYCLAQLIRVDAIRPLLNRYEREEVEQELGAGLELQRHAMTGPIAASAVARGDVVDALERFRVTEADTPGRELEERQGRVRGRAAFKCIEDRGHRTRW